MSRIDCISCRNIQIIAAYVHSKTGGLDALFEGLSYPRDRYAFPKDFFLNEDEWTTYDNFHAIFQRAKGMVGEKFFYYNCGASSAVYRSWGRFDYFARVFTTPSDGFKRLPFFNKNFNDTKEIEIICPPFFDKAIRKFRTILKIQLHDDMDVHKDYIGDPYARGLIASIPTVWGLPPAHVRQSIMPYDPVILFNNEPEFIPFQLEFTLEDQWLTARHPVENRRMVVGKQIHLIPERINGRRVYLGRYAETGGDQAPHLSHTRKALLITKTIHADGRTIVQAGDIFKAPYFIIEVTYARFPLGNRLRQVFRPKHLSADTGDGLVDTIDQLRRTIASRNEAYDALEKTNAALKKAKQRVDEYAKNLEEKVHERTAELSRAKKKLEKFNQDLKIKVNNQLRVLKRYDELRRYLSPQLTKKILSSGWAIGAAPQRKMMTVLFSDIRNFSALTDSIEPEEIFYLLNGYLSAMTTLIHHYDGTLNKIIGDGLLVFFGDPIPMRDHALRAVQMAVDMQKKVNALREEWRGYGYELGIGIGINTGYMTVGNIGSDLHKDYTVIGNQVNIAARLESLAKPGEILVSHRTYSQVKESVFEEKKGVISVKGIHSPIMTYNIKSMKTEHVDAKSNRIP